MNHRCLHSLFKLDYGAVHLHGWVCECWRHIYPWMASLWSSGDDASEPGPIFLGSGKSFPRAIWFYFPDGYGRSPLSFEVMEVLWISSIAVSSSAFSARRSNRLASWGNQTCSLDLTPSIWSTCDGAWRVSGSLDLTPTPTPTPPP